MEEKLTITSYDKPYKLLNHIGIEKPNKIWRFGSHFLTKIPFGPTLFSQNYPINLVGETKVDHFLLCRYIYIYVKKSVK